MFKCIETISYIFTFVISARLSESSHFDFLSALDYTRIEVDTVPDYLHKADYGKCPEYLTKIQDDIMKEYGFCYIGGGSLVPNFQPCLPS